MAEIDDGDVRKELDPAKRDDQRRIDCTYPFTLIIFSTAESQQEAPLPRVVICPSCQSKGIRSGRGQAARIRCPKCGKTFDVGGRPIGLRTGNGLARARPAATRPRPVPAARELEVSSPDAGHSRVRGLRPAGRWCRNRASRRSFTRCSERAAWRWSRCALVVVSDAARTRASRRCGCRRSGVAESPAPRRLRRWRLRRRRRQRLRGGGRRADAGRAATTSSSGDVRRCRGNRPPSQGGDGLHQEQRRAARRSPPVRAL